MSSRSPSPVIHRIVEHQAALCAGAVALRAGRCVLTRHEVNQQANVAARRLMAAGFRRGDVADVWMPAGADLAVVLLAVLKAGGCYFWTPRARRAEDTPHILMGTGPRGEGASIVAIRELLSGSRESSPNLPVLVRGSDPACLLPEGAASPVLVPHATLVALHRTRRPRPVCWSAEPGAWDLLLLLMAGAPAEMAATTSQPPRAGDRERRRRPADHVDGLHGVERQLREGAILGPWPARDVPGVTLPASVR